MSKNGYSEKVQWPWSVLGLSGPTGDLKQVKRAYAVKLKVTRPNDDPEGFRNLRAAFDNAKQRISWGEFDDLAAEEELQQVQQVTKSKPEPEPQLEPLAKPSKSRPEPKTEEPPNVVETEPATDSLADPLPDFEFQPVDTLEADDPEENGWEKVWAAQSKTAALLNVNEDEWEEKPKNPWGKASPDYDLAKWEEIVDDPHLVRLDYWEQFSSSLRYQVIEHLGWHYEEAKREAPKRMPRDFAIFLTERFDWGYDDNPHNTQVAEQSAYLRKAMRKSGVNMPEPSKTEVFGKAKEKKPAKLPPFFLRWWFLMIISGLFIFFRPIIAS